MIFFKRSSTDPQSFLCGYICKHFYINDIGVKKSMFFFSRPIFKNWSDSITNKKNIKVCIPGCGRGHDVVYLSKQGFDIYAFDFSFEAISYLKKQNDINNLNANIFCINFFNFGKKYNHFFDYIVEYTFYCAINPEDRGKYINKWYIIILSNCCNKVILF